MTSAAEKLAESRRRTCRKLWHRLALLLTMERTRSEAKARGEDPKVVELTDWRLHDLRRSARTGFTAIPAQDHVRELTIGHAPPDLCRIYDQHLYLAEKRALLDRWAKRLAPIVEPPPANVVALATASKAR